MPVVAQLRCPGRCARGRSEPARPLRHWLPVEELVGVTCDHLRPCRHRESEGSSGTRSVKPHGRAGRPHRQPCRTGRPRHRYPVRTSAADARLRGQATAGQGGSPPFRRRPRGRRAAWFPANVDAWSVRRVLLHLIEEVTRHGGHADILHESIDSATMYALVAAAGGGGRRNGCSPGPPTTRVRPELKAQPHGESIGLLAEADR